jgi:hypothetical protein
MDVQMMILLSGRERTSEEWREIFGHAGLQMVGIHDTTVDFSIVEGVPGCQRRSKISPKGGVKLVHLI